MGAFTEVTKIWISFHRKYFGVQGAYGYVCCYVTLCKLAIDYRRDEAVTILRNVGIYQERRGYIAENLTPQQCFCGKLDREFLPNYRKEIGLEQGWTNLRRQVAVTTTFLRWCLRFVSVWNLLTLNPSGA